MWYFIRCFSNRGPCPAGPSRTSSSGPFQAVTCARSLPWIVVTNASHPRFSPRPLMSLVQKLCRNFCRSRPVTTSCVRPTSSNHTQPRSRLSHCAPRGVETVATLGHTAAKVAPAGVPLPLPAVVSPAVPLMAASFLSASACPTPALDSLVNRAVAALFVACHIRSSRKGNVSDAMCSPCALSPPSGRSGRRGFWSLARQAPTVMAMTRARAGPLPTLQRGTTFICTSSTPRLPVAPHSPIRTIASRARGGTVTSRDTRFQSKVPSQGPRPSAGSSRRSAS